MLMGPYKYEIKFMAESENEGRWGTAATQPSFLTSLSNPSDQQCGPGARKEICFSRK